MPLDEIGDWSVDKLNILKDYSGRYSQILQNQRSEQTGTRRFSHGYIDAFAGAGEHVHKATGEIIQGSPLIALNLEHKFDEYDFIDLNPERVERLKKIAEQRKGVRVHHGDCNDVLLSTVFPKYKFEDFRRALCFLDPYGLQLQWAVMATAGRMRSIEIFLNFPVMDMNRNAKKMRIEDVDVDHRHRMTDFWGDESWHSAMFAPSLQSNFLGLFGDDGVDLEKNDNKAFVAAFQKRLKDVAGFAYVPQPIPMRNSKNAVVYYLFFASNNETGNRIASAIFKPYRQP